MRKALWILTQSPGLNLYRVMSFVKYFKKTEAETFPDYKPDIVYGWESDLAKSKEFANQIAKVIARNEVVIMQRCSTLLGACAIISLAKKYNKKLLLEIDDYAFNVDSSNPGFMPLRKGNDSYDALYTQLEECDGIITSTDNLRVAYQKFCMNEFRQTKKINIIKNGVDFSLWKDVRKSNKKNKKIRIGWQGAHAHFDDLKILMEVVPAILKNYKVEFHFVGLCPDFLKQNGVFFHEAVTIDKYPKLMIDLNLDIILAPLYDTEFNRGKSNLRILEAGVMRKPVIASGNKNLCYSEIINNSENGILANNTREWINAIEILINNPISRKKLGNKLYQEVKKNYNVKDIAGEYEAIL